LAWFSPNCVDTPALNFGTLWAGGIASPANPNYSVTELAFQLKNSGAKGLVTQAFCLDKALEAAKLVGMPNDRILLIGNETHPDALHFVDFLSEARYKPITDRVVNASGDVAYIVYSSGTTGLPKGVQLTHRNTIFNMLDVSRFGIILFLPRRCPKFTGTILIEQLLTPHYLVRGGSGHFKQ
jgi:4-coumarate--CoA ligase